MTVVAVASPRAAVRWRHRVPAGLLFVAPLTAILLAVFVWPLLEVVRISFYSRFPGEAVITLAKYGTVLRDPFYHRVAADSLAIAGAVTALTVLLGYPAAYYLVRFRSRYRHLLFLALISPLIISVVVRTLGWLMLLGAGGPLQRLLRALGTGPTQLLFNRGAILVGLTHVLLPLMILVVAGTLAGVDRRLEETARVLGASPAWTFLRVTLPLSAPGIVAGSVLVFSGAMGAYLTPFFLGGGRIQLAAVVIYDETLVVVDWPLAAALAVLLLLGVLVILGGYVVLMRRLVWTRG
jgi:putative spermidine/putrescine transport system permease protein